jgi:hypothetical protein
VQVSDLDRPPLAGKNTTKILIVLISLGGVFALCIAACWLMGSFANDALCDMHFEGCK